MARDFLRKKGYKILETNYRCSRGEIDIVARDKKELVFVEVRSRRSAEFGTPEESLTRTKIQHLVAVSLEYLQEHGNKGNWRIDLVAIRFRQDYQMESIHHLPYAVQL